MKLQKFFLPTILAVAVAGVLYLAKAGDPTITITPADVEKAVRADSTIVILDVRTSAEYTSDSGHLAKAVLIPVQELEARVGELAKFKDRKIMVYCRTGHRSAAGTDILRKQGYEAWSMVGGITRWRSENRPVVLEAH